MIPGRSFPAKSFLVFLLILLAIRLADSLFIDLTFSLHVVLTAILFLYAPVPFYWKRGVPAWIRLRNTERTIGEILLLAMAGGIVYFLFLRIPFPSGMPPPETTAPLSLPLAAQLLFLVALPEEVFFRGYLYDAFEEAGWEPVISTAFLFALAHVAIYPTPYRALTFFPGLVFGWGRRTSGSICIPIAVHFLYNLFPFVIGVHP